MIQPVMPPNVNGAVRRDVKAPRAVRAAAASAGFVLFAVVAVANSAGYRFGASDQAFYLPAVVRALDPALFPRDAPLLDAQARLTGADEIVAAAVRVGSALALDLPIVVALLYVAGLFLLYVAALAFGRALDGSVWTGAAMAAALTLRHGIAYSGANTLEAYFHPRLIVFAAGVLALAWFLRGRTWRALGLATAAGTLHPTTTVWFVIWIGLAAFVSDAKARGRLIALAALAAAFALWALTVGPLHHRLVRMDADWLAAIGTKPYLFPDQWPAYAWCINLAYPVLIVGLAYVRRREGRFALAERGLVAGALALFAIFLASLPFNGLRLALAIQLQIPRVFWMLDFLATALLVSWLTRLARSRAPLVSLALLLLAAARGTYIMTIEFPERPFVQLRLPPDDWGEAMAWARTTPVGAHWLAHPGHAYLSGSSVRLAASRDVFHEEVKDAALAMYSRPIAMRVLEHGAAVAGFDTLDASRARALAARYDLDYLITEARGLQLPVVHNNQRFVIYRLR